MSEAERIRRLNYKRNRKRWMLAQLIILAIVASIALGSFLIYKRLDRTYYIEYTENSSSDYKVHYTDNGYFEEEWLESGQSYVSSLVDDIRVDFLYEMNMDTSNVAFDYTYEVTAQMIISDKTSGAHIYDPTDVLIEKTTESVRGSDKFNVNKSVIVDFAKYNKVAKQFVSVYDLKNAKAALWITLKVDVLSASDEFEMNNENTHSVTVLVPLGEINYSIENTTSLPTGESKVLACKRNNNQKLFLGCSVAMTSLAVLLAIFLAAFAYLTKNEDVTYANRVRKIMNSYRSFIQRIYGEFDSFGYQIVQVKTFMELLSIRDTIQSPVLMSENKDETRAQFLVPTNTKILYLYEIKVDNYDELYGAHPEWTDDSLIKLDSDYKDEILDEDYPDYTEPVDYMALNNFDDVIEELELPKEESEPIEPVKEEEKEPNAMLVELYAEIGKLRSDIEKAQKQTTTYAPAEVVPYAVGAMKFGHFSAGGNVTINYHEMPDKETIKEVSKLFNKGCCQSDNATCAKCTQTTDCDRCSVVIVNAATEKPQAQKAEETVAPATVPEEPVTVKETEPTIEPVIEEITETVAEPVIEEVTEPVTEEVAEEITEAEETTEAAEITEVESTEEVDVAEVMNELMEMDEPLFGTGADDELEEQISEDSDTDSDQDPDADSDSDSSIIFYDENENKLEIRCRRSCLANIIQSENELTKAFYSELKNYILSFKGVKARMSWRHESFNRGRRQLFKLKVRGKTICLYCALDPDEYDVNKYFHKRVEAKTFEQVPMLVRIKNPGALKRAKRLVDAVMERYEIRPNASYVQEDFVLTHPYERTQALIDRGLIKILIPEGYVVADPRHIVKAEALKKMIAAKKAKKAAKAAEAETLTEEPKAQSTDNAQLEELMKLKDELKRLREYQISIEQALASPNLELKDINYVDKKDEEYKGTEEKPGVEVVNVVWRDRARKNEVRHYDPNGAKLSENDVVLVPARDEKNNTDVVKKATVAHGNHTVDPDSLKYPLRKILAVIKQRAFDALSADDKKPEPKKEQKSKLGTVKFLSDSDLNNTTKK